MLTGVLWVPALLYDLANYAVGPGRRPRCTLPVLYVIVAGAGLGSP